MPITTSRISYFREEEVLKKLRCSKAELDALARSHKSLSPDIVPSTGGKYWTDRQLLKLREAKAQRVLAEASRLRRVQEQAPPSAADVDQFVADLRGVPLDEVRKSPTPSAKGSGSGLSLDEFMSEIRSN